MSNSDLSLLLDHLRYWPEVRQFTWIKATNTRSLPNRPAGYRNTSGNLIIQFRGRAFYVEQVIAAWEERQLTASCPLQGSHPAA
jgi:hypothetical protein